MPSLVAAASPKIRSHWNYILALQRMANAIVSMHSRAKMCRTPSRHLVAEFFRTPAMVLAGASRITQNCATMAQLCNMVELSSAYRSACLPPSEKKKKKQQQRRRRVVRFSASVGRSAGRKRRRRCTPRRRAPSSGVKTPAAKKPANNL